MLSQAWIDEVDAFLAHQKAGGKPETTRRARRDHLYHLARRISAASPWEVSGAALLEYAGGQEWAKETRRSRRTTFLAFWRWGVATERCERVVADVLPMVKATPPRPRPTPDAAYREALLRAPMRETLMLRMAAEMGLRRSEVACAHTRDMLDDLVGWSLVVHGKGDKERVVPVPGSLARVIQSMPDGYLFPGDWGPGHLSPAYVGKRIRDLLPDQWTMHTLRHRFGTRAYALKSDLLLVQELLGHASPSTTRRYVELDRRRMRSLVEELEESDVRYA
ncbi:tyrosine-type recombinase/integrase [Microbacterium sp. A204]|uniref:tyrosine-type recombinase/integrase n=1 Tax=Microbacterium sp. A204 TaxID=3457321 RepID=UPI003FCF8CAD